MYAIIELPIRDVFMLLINIFHVFRMGEYELKSRHFVDVFTIKNKEPWTQTKLTEIILQF